MKNLYLILHFVFSLISYSQSPDLELQLFASGFNDPVNIKNAGDDKLFVAEKNGIIKIVNADGSIEAIPFLDIDARIKSTGGEQGLLGLAFHPNFNSNGYFYVNYIDNTDDTVISRFTRSSTNPLVADPNSELILLTYSQPYSNHNGGELAFGNDGYLYISSGDGGSGGDPQDRAQDLGTLLGKLLRIDVDNISNGNNYTVPPDNPFVGLTSALDEIWAYGLRNPWKFSFDRLTNDLWIGDVGQSAREEINFTMAEDTGGLNYGWRCYEGNNIYNSNGCPDPSQLTFPVAEYSHSAGRCSITGGYRYRGSEFPSFDGLYFFADVCSQEIGYITYDGTDWTMVFENFSGSFVAFGEDINGEMYVASLGGNIFKLIDANVLGIDTRDINSIKIYPNPANGELNINFANFDEVISSITIFDIQGKEIKAIERDSEIIQKIKLDDISKGIYILKIKSENGDYLTKKLAVN